MWNIVVIGIGNLGKRHVQSLLKSKLNLNISCVDMSDANFNEIREMEIIGTKELCFYKNIEYVPDCIDVAIISTSSGVRRSVFEELVSQKKVNNIIFEKVLFQKIEDYFAVKRILEEKGINAWVNCARREWNSWNSLREELLNVDILHFSIAGTNWGLGCNGIHMLDLISYFDPTIKVDAFYFECIKDSKRSGYKEVDGRFGGYGNTCKSFSISCSQGDGVETSIAITTERGIYVINEGKQIIYKITNGGDSCEKEKFEIEYQSSLTQKSVESIIQRGETKLPTYEVAMREHLQIVKPLVEYFEQNGGEKDLCPIT